MKSYARALSIAGSDSGGGAGIQADLKTFAALGCYGMSVITALTAQNTVGVLGIHEVPPEFVARQMDAVLGDIGADAVKIGMLGSAAVIRTVADRLRAHALTRIVLDPVMVAKSGDRLLEDEAVEALRAELLPLAEVLTPNLPEVAALLGMASLGEAEMAASAERLLELGPRSVLVKGGHTRGGESNDVLVWRAGEAGVETRWFRQKRIETANTHGTGCTLSSAIAAYRAQGADLPDSVEAAKRYISGAIRAGAAYSLGKGHGPVHHFFEVWKP
jgi:hydroxymethylpyrimidine/phosphomethylpyrimidine kinase